jgi:cold shock CspA family protein
MRPITLKSQTRRTVFCHYSFVHIDGHQALTPGSRVRFDYETPGLDGCDVRVLTTARTVQ